MRKPSDQRGAISRLEFVEITAVNHARNDLAHVKGLARIHGDHAVQFGSVKQGCTRRRQQELLLFYPIEVRHCRTRQRQCVHVVVGQVVGHAREPRVHVATAQVFSADDLADGRLDQGRAGQENRALVLDDDGFITHGRHVGAASGTRTHHHRDLRNALGRQVGLVEEDAAEVFAVRKHLVLIGQIRPA